MLGDLAYAYNTAGKKTKKTKNKKKKQKKKRKKYMQLMFSKLAPAENFLMETKLHKHISSPLTARNLWRFK